ncbi:MAG: ribosome maturation factor RimP [Alphaproteobacteria bacterium]|nr:ribosome maturation factor RimP [Alphaproteobacteria bacterium]
MSLVSDTVQTDTVLELIEPSLIDLGYEVVRVRFHSDGRAMLQVMIDRADGAEISVEDCSLVSRTISVLLDVADPITDPYEMEVSSPGLDRPLTRAKDFESFSGSEARVELKSAIEGRRRFRGRLLGLDGDVVRMVVPLDAVETEFALPFEAIEKAKIVLTDELLAAAQRERTNQG